MSHLLEVAMVGGYRVFYVKSQDSQSRTYFSAYVQVPEEDDGADRIGGQIVIDDRILPRLKERLRQVMGIRFLCPAS